MLNVTQNIPVHYDMSQHFSLMVTENGRSVINYTNNKYTETYMAKYSDTILMSLPFLNSRQVG